MNITKLFTVFIIFKDEIATGAFRVVFDFFDSIVRDVPGLKIPGLSSLAIRS